MPLASDAVYVSSGEYQRLVRREKELGDEISRLELQIKDLRHRLWGRKSERHVPKTTGEAPLELFSDPTPAPSVDAREDKTPTAPRKSSDKPSRPRSPKGPRPLDPALPREVITVPAPPLKQLMCPVTGQQMQPGYIEVLEVLARRAPEFYVKRLERTVFVSPAKTAPAYSPWPADVLPRSHVHASVVGYIAAAHYGLHLPFNRLQEDLARKGVDLPRSSQVSLMAQLDDLLSPLNEAVRVDALGDGYLRLDATSVMVQDPQRPGALREACLWAYRAGNGSVFFDYQPTKAVKAPDATLKTANFSGLLQTDAAGGLNAIGPPGQVIHISCFAHLRRPFFKAASQKEPDERARPYFDGINRLFRIDRLAAHFGLALEKRRILRERHSLPLFDRLVARARDESAFAPQSLHTGEGIRYLLNHHESLRRCLTQLRAELSNNPCEAAIRPIKIGANNWVAVGHPDAGPRLANLFTIVENCRQAKLDPEMYLNDIIARLPDHPASKVAQLLPRHWKPVATSAGA